MASPSRTPPCDLLRTAETFTRKAGGGGRHPGHSSTRPPTLPISATPPPKHEIPRMTLPVSPAHDDLLLFRLALGHGNRHNLFLSDGSSPSLTRIPHPSGDLDSLFLDNHVGILHGQTAALHHIVAALTPIRKPWGEYRLHLYHSTTNQSSPPLTFFFHHTDEVINLSRQAPGLMGFADLWRGVVLVNVLHDQPAPSYIHCLHESGIGIDEGNASDVRDIAIDLEGCINYVEFELKGLPHPQRDTLLMAGRPLNGVGCWRMDCQTTTLPVVLNQACKSSMWVIPCSACTTPILFTSWPRSIGRHGSYLLT